LFVVQVTGLDDLLCNDAAGFFAAGRFRRRLMHLKKTSSFSMQIRRLLSTLQNKKLTLSGEFFVLWCR